MHQRCVGEVHRAVGVGCINPSRAGRSSSAFAAARAARKPVLLYWGADWCPPCSRLKATVFRRPEFVERTRQFVAVNLDGDEPGAQRLGEEFGVDGYPTTGIRRLRGRT